jgi:hypothetical protein
MSSQLPSALPSWFDRVGDYLKSFFRERAQVRMAIHLASQRLGLVAQSLAKAKLAPELRDVRQSTRLKCVMSDGSPLCKMAGHW